MKIVLPIEKKPIIRTYNYLAYVFSILGTNENSYNWLCNQYIQLIDDGVNDFTFYLQFLDKIDVLSCEKMSCEVIKKLGIDYVEYIRISLNNGYYLYTCVDEYYIPQRLAFQKFHYIHDCLIYGIDEEKKELYLIGYDTQDLYRASNASFDQIIQSGFYYSITSIRKNEKYKSEINLNKIYIDLLRYLNILPEIQIGDFYYESATFGQKTNSLLKQHIYTMCTKQAAIDIRYIFLFYEHKNAMLLRISLLQKKLHIDNTLVEKYCELVYRAKRLYTIALKYNLKRNQTFLDNALRDIDYIAEKEREVLNKIITTLEEIVVKTETNT